MVQFHLATLNKHFLVQKPFLFHVSNFAVLLLHNQHVKINKHSSDKGNHPTL